MRAIFLQLHAGPVVARTQRRLRAAMLPAPPPKKKTTQCTALTPRAEEGLAVMWIVTACRKLAKVPSNMTATGPIDRIGHLCAILKHRHTGPLLQSTLLDGGGGCRGELYQRGRAGERVAGARNDGMCRLVERDTTWRRPSGRQKLRKREY